MTQSYRDNNTRSSRNNRGNNPRNNNGGNNPRNSNQRNSGNRSNNRNNQGNNPGTTLLPDEYWEEKERNRNSNRNNNRGNNPGKNEQIHWKSVSIVLGAVFAVGVLVGGLAIQAASHEGAKTESTVLFCQNGGGLLGISCH